MRSTLCNILIWKDKKVMLSKQFRNFTIIYALKEN